jgi:hypothetical protein
MVVERDEENALRQCKIININNQDLVLANEFDVPECLPVLRTVVYLDNPESVYSDLEFVLFPEDRIYRDYSCVDDQGAVRAFQQVEKYSQGILSGKPAEVDSKYFEALMSMVKSVKFL